MGVLRLYHWGEKDRRGGSGSKGSTGWSGAALEARLSSMGAQRVGRWTVHCTVYNLKKRGAAKPTAEGQPEAAVAAAVPLFLLKSEGAVFALHNGQLLQGGPELQHILTQAMAVKGEPPLKPRLSGAIDGTRYDLGDFRVFVGQARVSERGRGEVLAVEYRPCTQWENAPHPKRQRVANAGAGEDAASKKDAAVAVKKEGAAAAKAGTPAAVKAEGGDKPGSGGPAARESDTKDPPKGGEDTAPDGASCETLLDELAATVTGSHSLLPTEGKDGGGVPSKFLPDPAEFSGAGLDERQWSNRHSGAYNRAGPTTTLFPAVLA